MAHAFLEPAIQAAVVETKGKLGAPTTDELQTLLAQHAALINQQSTVIQQQQATIAALQGAIPTQITAAIASYNTSIVAPLVQQQAATAADLATKSADLASLTTVVAGKALASDVTTLTNAVNTKASSAAVATLAAVVDGKAAAADVLALTTTVAGKALASDLATTNTNVAANTSAIALRATTASVTALQASVTQNTADIATKASMAALTTQTGRIDGLITTTVPALQADTALRLLRSGDTSTGPQMQPVATLGGAAPRFDQTFGGLNSPVRAAYNIGATAVALGPGALTDPTPQGRKAQVIQVYLAMRTAPTLGVSTTIKIGTTPGGSDIYSKTYTLTALPVLNGLLQSVPTSIAELPAGTVLYAQVVNNLGTDGGKWDAIVQSYYKS